MLIIFGNGILGKLLHFKVLGGIKCAEGDQVVHLEYILVGGGLIQGLDPLLSGLMQESIFIINHPHLFETDPQRVLNELLQLLADFRVLRLDKVVVFLTQLILIHFP